MCPNCSDTQRLLTAKGRPDGQTSFLKFLHEKRIFHAGIPVKKKRMRPEGRGSVERCSQEHMNSVLASPFAGFRFQRSASNPRRSEGSPSAGITGVVAPGYNGCLPRPAAPAALECSSPLELWQTRVARPGGSCTTTERRRVCACAAAQLGRPIPVPWDRAPSPHKGAFHRPGLRHGGGSPP